MLRALARASSAAAAEHEPPRPSQVWIWCAIPFPMSDPYDEAPPWNLPWPGDSPIPSPTHLAAPLAPAPTAALAGGGSTASLLASRQGPPPIQLDALRQQAMSRRQIEIAQRQLSGRFAGLGSVGVWVAEWAADVAGWKQVPVAGMAAATESAFAEPFAGSVLLELPESSSAASLSVGDDHIQTQTAPSEDELPVDANFFFWLFICKAILCCMTNTKRMLISFLL